MRIALIQLAYGEGAQESVEERAGRVADLVRRVGHEHDLAVC